MDSESLLWHNCRCCSRRSIHAFNNAGSVGQGYEAAKELVFNNRVTQAIWGNYDSKAVDAYFFMNGPAFFKAAENAITYSKTAFSANKLSYDISNWKDYGLPSDGYFSRMISKSDAFKLMEGEQVNLAGNNGAGFIGSAEQVRFITTGQAMKEAMGVTYKPDYLLEFQLKDVTGLQNVIKYSDPMWQHGGKTITGFYATPHIRYDFKLEIARAKMSKICIRCISISKFKDEKYTLKELLRWFESVHNIEGKSTYNYIHKRYALFRCKKCGTFWEWRPLYEETIYGGEPGEWIKVSIEYVKKNYPDVRLDEEDK